MVKSAGSAIGEAIGHVVEENARRIIEDESDKHGFVAVRRTLKNLTGSQHRIDIVVEDQDNNPIILVEPKYLRYTKHNWDKASRLVAGHYNLRKTFKTIRKSIAVLAGNWTTTSVAFLTGFGVEIFPIQFKIIVNTLKDYGVPFEWAEADKETPDIAWERFNTLTQENLMTIGEKIIVSIEDNLRDSIKTTLTLGPDVPRELEEVEILIKSQHGEFYLSSFTSVVEAIQYLLQFQTEVPDIRTIFKDR